MATAMASSADVAAKHTSDSLGSTVSASKMDRGSFAAAPTPTPTFESAIGNIPSLFKDGIRLHPQPTSDPLDPLNWSRWRKNGILAVVMALYFMFTYVTTTTVPSFPDIQEYLGISNAQLNWTVAIPALGLALGPLIWSSPADIVGRRFIFIVGTTISLAATIGAAKASSYAPYMAARFFQGLGVSPAATVGLAIINDMFFEHERGQKIGMWVLAIDMGLLVGPLIGGFICLVDQFWVHWLTAIILAAILLAEIFFLQETLYPRSTMLDRMPAADGADRLAVDVEKSSRSLSFSQDFDIRRTKKLPFINAKPVPGMRHPSVWAELIRFCKMWRFASVVIATCTYCFCWYWWILSVITYIPFAYPQYTPQVQGLLFLGLILGTLFSEIICSGTLSDWIIIRLAKNNSGVRVAEMRLWLGYPAALISAIGLIIWGISIDRQYHWMVGQVAFFLLGAGIQMGNTVISSYIVDCYPLQSMSVITYYAVLLNLSAFINPFFIAPWVEAQGYTMTFAVQGIFTFFLSVPVLAALHYWGPSIRARTGSPSWVNPEYDALL